MSMADATATVVQHVFARLVRDGMLPKQMFENIAEAHDRLANETLLDDQKAEAMQVADVARLILMLSEGALTKPSLRLVENDEPQLPG